MTPKLTSLIAELEQQQAVMDATEDRIRELKAEIVSKQQLFKIGNDVAFTDTIGYGGRKRTVERRMRIESMRLSDSNKLILAGRRYRATGELGVVHDYTTVEIT